MNDVLAVLAVVAVVAYVIRRPRAPGQRRPG